MTNRYEKKRKRCGNPKPKSKCTEKRLTIYKAKQADKKAIAEAAIAAKDAMTTGGNIPHHLLPGHPSGKEWQEKKEEKEEEENGVVSNSQ